MNNLVNLNVNPCKMCMPMGAVSALMGIKSCMTILHGSQGCATYIRRHMATHYNEPVDIASSSLTEEGTVFGGEANLLKGLKNMIELYNPEVIGVCTTCLAETIGEDVGAIVKKFKEAKVGLKIKIINIASPGYGGTQNEGWFAACRAILEQTEGDKTPNGKINIITPQISPADTRWLKSFLGAMGVSFTLLPDLSENLDGATETKYKRLKSEGTSLEDIAAMAGAKLTIEFSEFTEDKNSPAVFLKDTYGVPYIKLPLPCGIRGMDKLIEVLKEAGGKTNEEADKERGRYLDAMVDSHKYCCQARAVIFGEPDFVSAMVRLCCENGIFPAAAATGSVSANLRETVLKESAGCINFHFEGEPRIMDDSDFAAIETACIETKANLLIGSSDARRIAHKLNIPLIRCAFPIHDHVGGQRVRILGFEGSLNILDQAANAMLDRTESSFRGELYEKYYDPQKSSHGDTEDTGNTGEELRKENSKSSSSVSPVSPCEIFLTLPEELGDVHVTVTTARAEPKKEGVSVLQQGDLAIDIARHTVFFGDEEINLFATEFDILKHFLSNPDIVFSREQIIKTIKGSDYPVTIRSVDTQILNLRRKLGRAGNMIETVRGAGYRLRKGSVPMESEKVRSRRFAAATSAGLVVDLHFGHADKFYIYESDGKETKYLETREVSKYCADPECGDKEDRWESVIRALADCEAVLCVKIGPTPEKRLKENGIDAIMTYEVVETAVTNAAKETKRRANYEIA